MPATVHFNGEQNSVTVAEDAETIKRMLGESEWVELHLPVHDQQSVNEGPVLDVQSSSVAYVEQH